MSRSLKIHGERNEFNRTKRERGEKRNSNDPKIHTKKEKLV